METKGYTNWLLTILVMMTVTALTASGCQPRGMPTPNHAAHVEHEHEMPELSAVTLGEGERLQIVATTSIVADVVANVGGDLIDLTALMPIGADPHSFEPTPQDVAALNDAHGVFINGAGLEKSLEPLLESAEAADKVIPMSHGIELLEFEGEHEGEGEHHHGADPHTWTDPNLVMVWTYTIEQALSALDPANAGRYEANAKAYETELKKLDTWVREQVSLIPEAERRIITDHNIFGYFAERYGFTQVGTIAPGYSTLAEPSAKELADLESTIRELGVRAVFVGKTVNPSLAETVAQDTGTQLVFLYTGSLSKEDGEAATYLDYMRYNVNAIVSALK
jgi:manganese/iron transport system substrate-binding protein